MKLRDWRIGLGLTLKKVAKELKTTIASLSRWETGERRTIRAKTVEKIFLMSSGHVTASDLYGQTPERIAELREKAQKQEIPQEECAEA